MSEAFGHTRSTSAAALFFAGFIMVLLGVFVEDREVIAGTLVGLGGVLMPLAVLLPRLTGSIKVSATGLEAELTNIVRAEASARGLPAQVTQRAVAVVASDTDAAVRALVADLLVAVDESYPDLTEIPVELFQDAIQDPRVRRLLKAAVDSSTPEADPDDR